MLTDHAGLVFFPGQLWMRLIGRLAFPIFAFFIAEGYRRTSDPRKYMLRLGLFAVISELPFDLVVYGNGFSLSGQNVFFTLLLGLAAISFYDRFSRQASPEKAMLSVLFCAAAASLVSADYGFFGVFMIFVFYICKERDLLIRWMIPLVLAGALLCFAQQRSLIWAAAQLFELCSVPLILLYNGKRGKNLKIFFYVFYPAHLLLIFLVRSVL